MTFWKTYPFGTFEDESLLFPGCDWLLEPPTALWPAAVLVLLGLSIPNKVFTTSLNRGLRGELKVNLKNKPNEIFGRYCLSVVLTDATVEVAQLKVLRTSECLLQSSGWILQASCQCGLDQTDSHNHTKMSHQQVRTFQPTITKKKKKKMHCGEKKMQHTALGSGLVLCRRDSGESMCVWGESSSSDCFFLGILKRDAMLKKHRRKINMRLTWIGAFLERNKTVLSWFFQVDL